MRDEIYGRHQSSIFGIDANVLALLTYFASMICGWIPIIKYVSFFAPLIIYLFEKNSNFVKFHAMQSFLLSVMINAITVLFTILAGGAAVGMYIGNIGTAAATGGFAIIISLAYVIFIAVAFVFMIIAAVKAAQYKEYHIPVVGGWASRISGT